MFDQVELNEDDFFDESVLDQPRDGLDASVWQYADGPDEKPVLTDEAQQKIADVLDWVLQKYKVPVDFIHIIGSITSNSYSAESDVDVHIVSKKLKPEREQQLNKMMKADYWKTYVPMHKEETKIGTHQIELYIQHSEFKDMASVGCYDFLNKTWVIGPDMMPSGYDPYADLYDKDMSASGDVMKRVRDVLLKSYELANVCKNAKDSAFLHDKTIQLLHSLKDASDLFEHLKEQRSVLEDPKSREDALERRSSSKWKQADSTFKLLSKFGYIGIMYKFQELFENAVKMNTVSTQKLADEVIAAIRENIAKSENVSEEELAEAEKMRESIQKLDEELKKNAFIMLVAGLMQIPGVMPQDALAKEMQNVPAAQMKASSPAVKKAQQAASVDKKQYGGMCATNVINAVAQVLFKEARGEKVGSDEIAGAKMVASVIMNRTGNDPDYICAVLKEKKAFSCMNDYRGGWTDATYVWYDPSTNATCSAKERRIYNKCIGIATQLLYKKFVSTVGNRNSYLNKQTCDKGVIAPGGWGTRMTEQIKVGNHHVGYLPEHDPKFVKPGTTLAWRAFGMKNPFVAKMIKQYTPVTVSVKKGDTLRKIAARHHMLYDEILQLNNMTGKEMLKIGQRLKVKPAEATGR